MGDVELRVPAEVLRERRRAQTTKGDGRASHTWTSGCAGGGELSEADVGDRVFCFEQCACGWTAWYELRVCLVCGHAECPCCNDWCDRVHTVDDDDVDLCCEGECRYVVPGASQHPVA